MLAALPEHPARLAPPHRTPAMPLGGAEVALPPYICVYVYIYIYTHTYL